MTARQEGCPLSAREVVDTYFMEHRARLIDIAAFLDRVDRVAAGGPEADDFRLVALRQALEIVGGTKPERVRRVLELLSDPTTEPIPKAGTKGASGAYPG